MNASADITMLLDAARGGDRNSLDRVLATLYQELHTMARRQLAGQHGQTLDATALVHEAYLKLIGRREAQFDDRAHFFAYAASACPNSRSPRYSSARSAASAATGRRRGCSCSHRCATNRRSADAGTVRRLTWMSPGCVSTLVPQHGSESA
jgi:hypothetical protein